MSNSFPINRRLSVAYSASGAYNAGKNGDVTVIVDVVDMSTTAEAARESGASQIFGAALAGTAPPVPVDPLQIGRDVGAIAKESGASVVLITEPRVGADEERQSNCAHLFAGLKEHGVEPIAVLPNIGYESAKLTDLREKIVIIATASGGVAFDAAYNAGAKAVLTATTARTAQRNGRRNLELAAQRAVETARSLDAPISIIAASHNALEDIDGAHELAKAIMRAGFLDL